MTRFIDAGAVQIEVAPDLARLNALYWQLRALRDYETSRRRLLYRRISEEKQKIILLGADKEEIRLFCRHLANPRNKRAETAYLAYRAQLKLPFG